MRGRWPSQTRATRKASVGSGALVGRAFDQPGEVRPDPWQVVADDAHEPGPADRRTAPHVGRRELIAEEEGAAGECPLDHAERGGELRARLVDERRDALRLG